MANTSESSVSLLAVGDVMVARPDDTLLDKVADSLGAADIAFGNCEWPYSEEAGDTHPVEAHLNDAIDEGDLFVPGHPDSVSMLGRSGFNVMSFANNHCMHSGYRVFFRTMELLRESGIAPVGAGSNMTEARRPVIIERNGVNVAFIACTSALLPGTQAGRRIPGVSPLRRHSYFANPAWETLGLNPQVKTLVDREDLNAICDQIRAARDAADVVAISCHWGMLEDRVAIGEYQRDAAHAFIDHGADLILGHGPLVTKGIEVYKRKVIFYSLGKFAMKGPIPTGKVPIGVTVPFGEESRKGIAAMVSLGKGGITSVAFKPCYADESSRPNFLSAGDARFKEIVEDTQRLSADEGLNVKLTVEADQVTITG